MRRNFKRHLAPTVREIYGVAKFESKPMFGLGVRWVASYRFGNYLIYGSGCAKREAIAAIRRIVARARGQTISERERETGRRNRGVPMRFTHDI
jgi:hypothetical protein